MSPLFVNSSHFLETTDASIQRGWC